jgi:hypothetical protein
VYSFASSCWPQNAARLARRTDGMSGQTGLAQSRTVMTPATLYPPPQVTGNVGGKYPISLKKLQRGDARWASEKEILGFLVDGEGKTVRTSNARATNIIREIQKILKKKRVEQNATAVLSISCATLR